MEANGRGIYHGTGVTRNDLVIFQDHRQRWRLDLITSASGNHAYVTGPNAGYGSAEEAFQAALDVQRVRGIRGKSHVWIADREGNITDYEPMEANGRRSGILSDGTRVNVYYDESGSGDPWTAVPHSEDWDTLARGDMRSMLGMSEHATGISQWSEGQEGRHLGRRVPWDAVPQDIKRHIEQRVASEASMEANGRRKKTVTVDDLPESSGGKVLACPSCNAEFSAMKGDYFMMPKGEALACQACGVPLVLRKRTPARRPPAQEARHSPGNLAWDEAEENGLVRIVVEPEEDNYFDVYGEPDTSEERNDIIEQIDRDGLNHFASQYRKRRIDEWETADSIGMVIGDLASSGYEDDLKRAALDALKKSDPRRR